MKYGVVVSSSLPLLSTRAGRAGVVHNPLRGLSLQRAYPISPFTPVAQRSHNFGSPGILTMSEIGILYFIYTHYNMEIIVLKAYQEYIFTILIDQN